MAIAFPYYFALTELPASIITDAWYEQASTGNDNFAINSTGSFRRQLSIGTSDFTMLCTIDRLKSASNSGAVEVLAGQGWTFGIDGSNFFYLQSSVGEAYTFDQVNIGEKTCFSLVKNDAAFTLTSFNVPAQAVESAQTQFLGASSNVTGTGLYFAGNTPPTSGVKNFYGTVDQMVLLNQPLSIRAMETLFSGFLQQTVTYTPVVTGWSQQYATWEQTGNYSSGQIQFLRSGAEYFAADVLSSFTTSGKAQAGYYGEMLMVNTGSYRETTTVDLTPFVNPCTTFGSVQISTHAMGGMTGLPTGFTVPVLINYFNPALFSFDFSALIPGMNLDLTYAQTGGVTTSVAQNTGYYSGFIMNGVNAPEADSVKFGYFPRGLGSINQIATPDLVNGAYYAPGARTGDTIYLDGLPFTNYTVSGDYITLNDNQDPDEVIYDKFLQSQFTTLQSGGIGNAKTGDYFNKTSAVFTGSPARRSLNYLETHRYHLYHNKNIPSGAEVQIYSNNDINWL